MPVSVTARIEPAPIGTNIVLRLRIEGQEVAIEAPLAQLMNGEVIGFFDAPAGTLLRPKAKRIKRASMKQERRVEELGGNRQSGSGARPGYKGDGRIRGKYRIENKLTTKESFRVTLADLSKIRSECEGLEVPIFEVQFLAPHTLSVRDEWVLMPRKEWEKHVHANNTE